MALRKGYEKVAHLYDVFDTKENVEFFTAYGERAGEILDIGAGTGRIAIPMAERGVKVWCVEPSPAMLHQLRLKLQERPDLAGRVSLVDSDAADFGLGRVVPAALMSGSFDHLLDDGERLKALANIADHLEAGGKLVFDIGLGYMDDSPLRPAGEKTVKGKTYRRFVGRKVLPGGKIAYTLVFEILEGGRTVERIEQESSAAVIDRSEVHRLLKVAGFNIASEFGSYGSAPYREGDDTLVVEAIKQKG